MSDTPKQFSFDPLYGTMFPGARCWSGNWSETGGAPTHLIALGEKDGVHRVAFKTIGGRKWTYCDITFATQDPDELERRNHKGFVTFKGTKLNLWLNYAKDHEGESEHERYDLKPSSRAKRPF